MLPSSLSHSQGRSSTSMPKKADEVERCARMSEPEFRRNVFYQLAQIKQRIKYIETSIEAQRCHPRQSDGSPAAITPRALLSLTGLSTQEEVDKLVENIQSAPENREILVEILGRAPRKGSSPKDVVYAVMKKTFDWSMTRHLNIRGTKEKNSIYKHPLYSVIVDAVKLGAPQISDGDLWENMKNYLKNCGTNYKRREATQALEGAN